MHQQIVLALRAIAYGEPVGATAEAGVATTRLIDSCYERAAPLVLDWRTPAEQSLAEARHWSRRRWAT
jgi:hypothetical protein